MASRDNPDFLSADSIKKDKVVNEAGDDLGKIEDLMIDLDNGRVAYAVLSFGGFMGMGDKLFAIPWQALSMRLHEHAFTLDIPRDVLQKAEGFDKGNWPVTRDELARTYNYYGYQPYWQTGTTGQTGKAGVSSGAREKIESQGPAGPGSTASRENPDFLSADSIKSDKVVNGTGDHIGKIEELMIDLENGMIGYAVLSHGGFLGIGSKLFAIPWQALTLKVHEHNFLLDIPKETLDKAEGIDKDNWPLTHDDISRTFTYYGYQPYWQTGAVTGVAAAVATGTTSGKVSETESERKARQERERPQRTEQTAASSETVSEKVTRTETEIRESAGTEDERKARQERERLEALRRTEEEKVSQLEKQRMEKERQAQAQRECLARLERERAEAERQAEAERRKLAQLESELQEATRREKTEEVTRLEKEMREVKIREETQRTKVTQLEKERTEVEKQAQAEREKLAQLESESTEKGRQAETEKERLTRLERERTETEKQVESQRERLAQMERERMEAQRRVEATPQRESPDFMPACTIAGYKVINTNGDNLGQIEDLMIDLKTGRVAYAALSLGGFMGISDKLFGVPWQTLSYVPDEQAFILAVPRSVLEKAEGFDKDKCPTTRGELSRTYTYYGYQPYWTKMTQEERIGMGRLDTAEELMAAEDVEDIKEREKKETDPGKLAELERKKKIAEKRAHKYD